MLTLTRSSRSSQSPLDKQIVPRPPAPHPLPKDVRRYGHEAYEGRGATKHVHNFRRPLRRHPIVVGKVGESVEHKVLE